MTRNIIAALLLLLIYVLPVLGNPAAMGSAPWILAVGGGLSLWFSRPASTIFLAMQQHSRSRGSGAMILLAGVIAHAVPMIEWKQSGLPGFGEHLSSLQFMGSLLLLAGLAITVNAMRRPEGSTYWRVRNPCDVGVLITILGQALLLGGPVVAFSVVSLMILVHRLVSATASGTRTRSTPQFPELVRSIAGETIRRSRQRMAGQQSLPGLPTERSQRSPSLL